MLISLFFPATSALPLEASIVWFDISSGWSQTSTFANALTFCENQEMHLCRKEEYCADGAVVGGTKGGDQWAPYLGDGDNAWVQVGTHRYWGTCTSHHDESASGVRPSWGTESRGFTWRNFIACCGTLSEYTTTTTTTTGMTTTTTTSTFTSTTSMTSTITSTTTSPDFDCEAGLSRWKQAWSMAKKAWCCHHESEGCEYDCDAGYEIWDKDWSEDKKAWCCLTEATGCTTTTLAPSPSPTPNPNHVLILEKLGQNSEEIMELKNLLQHLQEMHTQAPTTTTVAAACNPKKPKHEKWCKRHCDDPKKVCKSFCPGRCLTPCRCQQRSGGKSRHLQQTVEAEVKQRKIEEEEQDAKVEELQESLMLI